MNETKSLVAARKVARGLRDAGREVWFVGGCVRDDLLGREPADYDLVTSARPEEVQRLFPRHVAIGKQFGVIGVLEGGLTVEVASFRTEAEYRDGRHPSAVGPATAEEDVRRRDFTINGLLMDPWTLEVVDLVGGKADLEAGVIRCIGEPAERFAEDHLRILRAVRFAARLDFVIEAKTAAAIKVAAPAAGTPSPERVKAELERMWTEGGAARALRMLRDLEVLPHVLPELGATMSRSPEARWNPEGVSFKSVLDRTQAVLAAAEGEELSPSVAWAIVLDDLVDGFPVPRSREARRVLERLHSSRDLMNKVEDLVRWRDRLVFATDVSRARRRLVGAFRGLDALIEVHRLEGAVASSRRPEREWTALARAPLPPPSVDGRTLMAQGVAPGPALGRALRRARFIQLDAAAPPAGGAKSEES